MYDELNVPVLSVSYANLFYEYYLRPYWCNINSSEYKSNIVYLDCLFLNTFFTPNINLMLLRLCFLQCLSGLSMSSFYQKVLQEILCQLTFLVLCRVFLVLEEPRAGNLPEYFYGIEKTVIFFVLSIWFKAFIHFFGVSFGKKSINVFISNKQVCRKHYGFKAFQTFFNSLNH